MASGHDSIPSQPNEVDQWPFDFLASPHFFQMSQENFRQLGYIGLLAPIRQLSDNAQELDLMASPDADAEIHRRGAKMLDEFFDFKSFDADRQAAPGGAMQLESSAASTQQQDVKTPRHDHTEPSAYASSKPDIVSTASENVKTPLISSSATSTPQLGPFSITPTAQPHLPPSVPPWNSEPTFEPLSDAANTANIQRTHTALQMVLSQESDGHSYVEEEDRLTQSTAPTSGGHGLDRAADQALPSGRPASVENTPAMQLQQELDQSHSTPTPTPAALPPASADADTVDAPQRSRKRARQPQKTSPRLTRSKKAKVELHREDTVIEGQLEVNTAVEVGGAWKPPSDTLKVGSNNDHDPAMPNMSAMPIRPVGGHLVGGLELRRMQADPDATFWSDLPKDSGGQRKTRAQLAAEKSAAPSAVIAAKKRHAKKKG